MGALAARRARLRHVGLGCAYRHARDHDIQRASLGSAALGADASGMAKDGLLADVEAQAHTRGIARRAIRRAVEETEDRLKLLRWDPDPLVGDGEPHPAVVRTDVDRYRAATRRVLDRVRDEVVQDLLEVIAIGGHDILRVATD